LLRVRPEAAIACGGEEAVRRTTLAVRVLLALLASAGLALGADFQVVVHPSVKGSVIRREVLSAIFTGASSRWGDESQVRPVDQSSHSAVRQAFTAQVLGQSVGEVQLQWQSLVAKRRILPPPVRSSDELVLEYVAAHEGAIGYISPDASVPAGVRRVDILD
jgi:ABC-type phosphate transport system substrate-binding protein